VRRFLPLFIAVVAGTLTACAGHDVPLARPSGLSFATIAFGHRGTLKVRIADDPTERAHGLMGVARLPSDEGMVFLFPQPTGGRFWMKDTRIPLAIAFVDVRHRIVAIREMVPCTSDPCPTYGAPVRYLMAVEANAKWFERHGIAAGDRVTSLQRPADG
jgi:uncharacterized protein